ncbi:MAG: hypothetical protein K8R54_17960 [Bacteroidales bacterium]|nr:hypothetical protein [Bacteroidales bacterium]
MFHFNNKKIIILSTDKWGDMFISKHHYAINLSKNNQVYFFNPPDNSFDKNFTIEKYNQNLLIVTYNPNFPKFFRFHLRKTYDLLINMRLRQLLKKIKLTKVDVIWNFSAFLLSNYKAFNYSISIYHPVDNSLYYNELKIAKVSHFIFSVSQVIIDRFRELNKTKFINHGLSDYFVKFAEKKMETNDYYSNSKIQVGFTGNLLVKSIDSKTIINIVKNNPLTEFHFWGSYVLSHSNLGGWINSQKFIDELKSLDNSNLYGPVKSEILAKNIQNMDALISIYDLSQQENKGANGHKIIEYLSTGKVIISSHISTYAEKRALIEMVDDMHNENLPELFKKVINNLDYYNNPELQRKRIEFALNNTYEKQIKRIEKYISKNYSLLFIKK